MRINSATTLVPKLATSLLLIFPLVCVSTGAGAFGEIQRRNVPHASGIKSLAIGEGFVCAATDGGHVLCWGQGSSGQLAIGGIQAFNMPVLVNLSANGAPLSDVVQVVAGGHSVCALLADTSVSCWGSNDSGALGIGRISFQNAVFSSPSKVVSPAGVGLLTGITKLAESNDSVCALANTGHLYCWGVNTYGQLGISKATNQGTPSEVVGINGVGFLGGVTDVALGGGLGCAVVSDGAVACWGWGSNGQLGNGSISNSLVPVQVSGVAGSGALAGVSQVSINSFGTCATLTNSGLDCWGGTTGVSSSGSAYPVPVPMPGGGGLFSGVAATAGGEDWACALLTSSQVSCWGGQMNEYESTHELARKISFTPTPLLDAAGSPLTNVSQVAASPYETCLVFNSGAIDCLSPTLALIPVPEFPLNDSLPVPPAPLVVAGVNTLSVTTPSSPATGITFVAEAVNSSGNFQGRCTISAPNTTCAIAQVSGLDPVTVRFVQFVDGDNSLPVSVGPFRTAFSPSQVAGLSAYPYGSGVSFSWIAAQPNGADIANYSVTVKNAKGLVVGTCSPKFSNIPACDVSVPRSGQALVASVTATNAVGPSPPSVPVTISPLLPISISAPPTMYFAYGVAGTAVVSSTNNAQLLSMVGAAPPGLAISHPVAGSVQIAGTPSKLGTYPVTFKAGSAVVTTKLVIINIPSTVSIVGLNAGINSSAPLSSVGLAMSAPSVQGLPYWASCIINASGAASIVGTPPVGQSGNYEAVIQSPSFANGFSIPISIVVAQSPSIHPISDVTINLGQPVSIAVQATGGFPTSINLSVTGLPPGVSLSVLASGMGVLTGKPSVRGKYQVSVDARCASALATAHFALTVK